MLRLADVDVRAGSRTVLRGVNLDAARSGLAIVTGSNGSGKTSLLRVVAGITRPSGGARTFDGRRVAFVAGAFDPPPVRAGRWIASMARVPEAGWSAALGALGFDGDLDRACRELSFGNLRKLALGAALAGDVELVVIDELSAGLDDRGRAGLVALLTERTGEGAAAVVSDQATARSLSATGADGVLASAQRLLLSEGRLVAAPTEVRSEPAPDVARFAGTPAQLDALRSHARTLGVRELPHGAEHP